jgi:DNA-directed RNA polymerase
MRKYEIDKTYAPKIRIHLDACNSGSQFTSAITRDKAGCIATNVIPTFDEKGSQVRKDAYLLVSNKSIKLTEEELNNPDLEEDKKKALPLIKQMLLSDGRKICKRPVMVSNYGGTNEGRINIIQEMFLDFKIDRKLGDRKAAQLFAKIIGDSITGVLNGGKAFEIYIQKMNSLIVKGNRPVIWNTNDGFHVVHFKNRELKTKRISCLLPSSRKKTTIIKKIYSKKANGSKMRSAISPNYIHSLDAELLRMVALRLEEEGIYNSDWIHDSFGCHPNYVSRMLQITKEEFLSLINSKPLERLDNELRSQIIDTKANEKSLKQLSYPDLGKDNFKIDEFEQLMVSNWFFS